MARRASRILLPLVALLALAASCVAEAADPNKILRLASPDIETLDPHQINDSPSSDVADAIFEGLYEWDYFASPARLAPLAAVALPEITGGGKVWTIRMRPGIHFTDDPAFAGKRRELTAADIVYSLKRLLDPNLHRGGAQIITDLVVGARAIVDAAQEARGEVRLRPPDGGPARARSLHAAAHADGAELRQHRELPDGRRGRARGGRGRRRRHPHAGGRHRAVPVEAMAGAARGSCSRRIPDYAPARFPESADPAHAATVRAMQGKALPQVGVIEISVIEEDVTRLLEFDRGRLDYVVLRSEIANRQLVDGKVKPDYAARGITRHVFPEPYLFSVYINVADPVVGGMSNERVALRRAMALAVDVDTLIKVVYAGQALPANQLVPPRVTGHDPALPPRPRHDHAAANALLDRFGYGKRDPDGYRRAPDDKPLTLSMSLRTAAISREIQTLWKKDMDAIGLRMQYRLTPFQDLLKELDAGNFQMYFGGYGGTPSGFAELIQLQGKEPRDGERQPVPLGRLRPRDGGVRAQSDGSRPDRRRAQDVGHRADVRADHSPHLPARERFRAAVGAGLQPARLQDLLEIPRHRSRAPAAGDRQVARRCHR